MLAQQCGMCDLLIHLPPPREGRQPEKDFLVGDVSTNNSEWAPDRSWNGANSKSAIKFICCTIWTYVALFSQFTRHGVWRWLGAHFNPRHIHLNDVVRRMTEIRHKCELMQTCLYLQLASYVKVLLTSNERNAKLNALLKIISIRVKSVRCYCMEKWRCIVNFIKLKLRCNYISKNITFLIHIQISIN